MRAYTVAGGGEESVKFDGRLASWSRFGVPESPVRRLRGRVSSGPSVPVGGDGSIESTGEARVEERAAAAEAAVQGGGVAMSRNEFATTAAAAAAAEEEEEEEGEANEGGATLMLISRGPMLSLAHGIAATATATAEAG